MQKNFPIVRTMTGLATLACALLVMVPAASAQTYGSGTMVGKTDYDYLPQPTALATVSVCAVDVNGNGAFSPEDIAYLNIHSSTCATPLQSKDIRLVANGDLKPGTEVGGMDRDVGLPQIGPLSDMVRYAETADGGFDTKDYVYLDIVAPASKTVNVGDLRLTKAGSYAANTYVHNGDFDVNSALLDTASGGVSLSTTPSAVYKAGSTVYINVDKGAIGTADTVVEEKDVRLLSKTPNPFMTLTGADVRVTKIDVPLVEVEAGKPFQVFADVINQGTGPGPGLVLAKVGGVVADVKLTPVMNPAETKTITLTLNAPSYLGAAPLEVNDLFQIVTVVGPADGSAPAADPQIAALQSAVTALQHRLDALEANANTTLAAHAESVQTRGGNAPAVDPVAVIAVLFAAVVWVRTRKA